MTSADLNVTEHEGRLAPTTASPWTDVSEELNAMGEQLHLIHGDNLSSFLPKPSDIDYLNQTSFGYSRPKDIHFADAQLRETVIRPTQKLFRDTKASLQQNKSKPGIDLALVEAFQQAESFGFYSLRNSPPESLKLDTYSILKVSDEPKSSAA